MRSRFAKCARCGARSCALTVGFVTRRAQDTHHIVRVHRMPGAANAADGHRAAGQAPGRLQATDLSQERCTKHT